MVTILLRELYIIKLKEERGNYGISFWVSSNLRF